MRTVFVLLFLTLNTQFVYAQDKEINIGIENAIDSLKLCLQNNNIEYLLPHLADSLDFVGLRGDIGRMILSQFIEQYSYKIEKITIDEIVREGENFRVKTSFYRDDGIVPKEVVLNKKLKFIDLSIVRKK